MIWPRPYSSAFSPIAYVVLGLVMVLGGFSFTAALTDLKTGAEARTLAVHTFNSPQFWLAYFFIFPVLTMRLFAEEVFGRFTNAFPVRQLLAHPRADRFDATGFAAALQRAGLRILAVRELWRAFGWFVAEKPAPGVRDQGRHPG